MEDEFYNLSVKGDDLKTYVRRFQELVVLCPNMISPPKDVETPVESSIPVSPSSSIGSSSPVRSITPPPDYPFDEFIFAELNNSLWIIPRPLGNDELTEKELKQIEANDQAIQTILLGLHEDIYAVKAKLFNEWEMFTSIDGESIESYYHRFLKLVNDLKRNKHFSKKIASNLKFLNNLQPEWSRHVTIVHQTKDLHTADYTQLYDFLKYNQKENVGNLNGYNDVQNVRNQVIQNAIQNQRIQNVGNQNGQIAVPGNANQNPNGNGNLVAAHAEGNATGHNGN
nr:reverse transcriptase domain-containing protein [Tanacetum cinerariifolium]